MLIYLTEEEILAINPFFTVTSVLRDRSSLLAALARPLTIAYYQQADIAMQAAILIEGIVTSHPFIDGNKRTGTAAGLIFLRLNGYTIEYSNYSSQDELGQQVVALVIHQITLESFTQWLRVHLVAIH